MVGVDADEILFLRVVLLDVGEQLRQIAIRTAKTPPELFLIDFEFGQTHAGDMLIEFKEALRERQMRFYRRVKFEPLGIPWMHVRDVQIEELIRLIECLELHDGVVSCLGGGELPRSGIQLIVAAQCAAGKAVACPCRSGGIVAEVCHAL